MRKKLIKRANAVTDTLLKKEDIEFIAYFHLAFVANTSNKACRRIRR